MTEIERRAKCWSLAKALYVRWHSMHGVYGHEEAWLTLGEWDQGYWYGVAEFVFDNFEEKKQT
jgi:hypothetical protein